MATHADSTAAIDRVLSGIDAPVLRQHRMAVGPGDAVAIPRSSLVLVYVISGSLVERAGGSGVSGASAGRSATEKRELTAGDARLYAGDGAYSLLSDDAFVLVSEFDRSHFDRAGAGFGVLDLLPDTVTVTGLAHSDPAVAALAAELGTELRARDPRGGAAPDPCAGVPGNSLICQLMAKTVLVSVIRAWVVRGCAPEGWPSRTNDPYLDRVVEAIHADPARDWTVEDLARTGAMSRTVFAERFREATGTSPAEYLAEVRIRSAQDLLARGLGVSEVSRAIGYGSDDGFSRAFRRRVGISPSAWRAEARTSAQRA